ncbi:MAG: HDOD domain-containing protein [Gammaproteobacteria bacterium]|nr:HDOD domain-containing protein [Gammaproteobacteria bacterium]MDH5801571.1 HDOD domain-containing protein [Gammaproteobacteria bacterium]
MEQQSLIDTILRRMDQRGDLPIFSASVNKVQMISSDPDSDAVALAMEMLKDVDLSAKVLKLANSPFYNRGGNRFSTLSRAIVLLGFDAIKSCVLTLKIIDSFQEQNPEVDLSAMLVSSYMAAGFVRDLATECGQKQVERSYICGLLYNLGEIIVAYCLPEAYLEMQEHSEQLSALQSQKKVLGMSLLDVGRAVVERWEFPENVVKTLAPVSTSGCVKKDEVLFNRTIAGLTHELMAMMYSKTSVPKRDFSKVLKSIAKAAGIKEDAALSSLKSSFKNSCDMAVEFGLSKSLLMPGTQPGQDESFQEIYQQLSDFTGSKAMQVTQDDTEDDGYNAAPREVSVSGAAASQVNPSLLLDAIQKLTTLIAAKTPVNTVFKAVLDAVHTALGYDRVMLCLLSTDHRSYTGRMVEGKGVDKLKNAFNRVSVGDDLFSQRIHDGRDVLVIDAEAQAGRLPKFLLDSGVTGFSLAGLVVNGKPIGVFYADKAKSSKPISLEEHQSFVQLVAQAHLALQLAQRAA